MKFDFKRLDPRQIDFKKLDRKWWIAGGVILLVLIGVVFFSMRSRAATAVKYETVSVKRGTLTSTVGATGSVRADQSTVITWQTSGRVEAVNVQIGDKVATDQELANLLQSSLPQDVILAQGDLVSAQQNLETLMQSDTVHAQAEQAVAAAQQALSDTQKKYNSLSYPRASDAVIRNTHDQLVLAQRQLGISTARYHQFSRLGENNIQRAQAEQSLTNNMIQVSKLQGTYNYYIGAPTDLEFNTAKAAVTVAQAQLADAQRELDRVKNGPTADDIAVAKAKLAAAQATLNEGKIIAPFDGVITQADSRPGDIVALNTTAFRIDDISHLLIDLQVSEVDINNVAVDQPVTVTFDAIQGKSYDGKVIKVNQAGDVSNSAVNFTVTVELTKPDSQVKPGMSATVTITVKQVDNALLVPNRALQTLNGQRVVFTLANGRLRPIQVHTGATSDTFSEVVSGDLKEGDLIVLNPNGTSTGTTTRTGAAGGFGGGGAVRFP